MAQSAGPRVPRPLRLGGEPACERDLGLGESLEAYFQTISPIMNEVGIEMVSEPEIFEVQNIVKR